MRPWTRWPITWSGTSPSIASWDSPGGRTLMRDDGDRGNAQAEPQAGAQIKPQRLPDVRRVQHLAAGRVGPGFLGRDTMIGARPVEGEAERAGQRRFRPAGIGRAVAPR